MGRRAYQITPEQIETDSEKLTETGCWIWLKYCDKDGYGVASFMNRPVRAHRLSFQIFNGQIPIDSNVLHSCDTPACVNPRHLITGTQSRNIKDCVARGRHPQVMKTHCPKGHEYSGSNLHRDLDGHRNCRSCNREKATIRRKSTQISK